MYIYIYIYICGRVARWPDGRRQVVGWLGGQVAGSALAATRTRILRSNLTAGIVSPSRGEGEQAARSGPLQFETSSGAIEQGNDDSTPPSQLRRAFGSQDSEPALHSQRQLRISAPALVMHPSPCNVRHSGAGAGGKIRQFCRDGKGSSFACARADTSSIRATVEDFCCIWCALTWGSL